MKLATPLLLAALSACAATPPSNVGLEAAYRGDMQWRRSHLVTSLVNPGNAYSALRIARYATGGAGDWERLPTWNPRVSVLRPAALDAPAGADGTSPSRDPRALPVAGDEALAPEDLRALGETAFFRYPVQLAPAPPAPLTRQSASDYGLWLDDTRGAGGLVSAEMADGSFRLAMTCATCHADIRDGAVVPGLPNGRLMLGRLIADSADARGAADENLRARLLAWGPGRVDVTTADATLPIRIPDLRPARWLPYLHYDATVRQRDVVDLAIRIETLIITAHGQALRPPRVIALALATYVWTLADQLAPAPPATAAGASVFRARCAGCHGGDAFTGPARPLAVVGTDPTLGESPDRGTGSYRVPSLRGVASRPTLLHDGSLPDLAALLDPARLEPGYQGGARGPGPVVGHEFGLDLGGDDRGALLAYLEGL